MMADLENVHAGINAQLTAQDKEPLTLDDLLVKLFEEVQYVWPKMGYPPLVTPFSQYVKNVALLNIMSTMQGKERFQTIDNNTWDMLLGKAGKLPGPLAPEIIELAKEQGREFYTGVPQDNFPDELDKYREEMEEKGWDTGQDDEELFELAMHERQYRDYKSGVAKERFYKELQNLKDKERSGKQDESLKKESSDKDIEDVKSPYYGRIYFELSLDMDEAGIQVGDKVEEGERICYLESHSTYQEINACCDGEIVEINFKQGDMITKDDIIARIRRKR